MADLLYVYQCASCQERFYLESKYRGDPYCPRCGQYRDNEFIGTLEPKIIKEEKR